MSFGFSVGDFIAVGQLTWTVYRGCKGAPGEFQELSRELSTLHTILHELEDEAKTPTSLLNRRGGSRKAELVGVVQNLEGVLKQIEDIVKRYQSLGRDQKKTWDRVKFAKEDLTGLRSKMLVHMNGINVFVASLSAGSLARIEAVLDELVQDIKAGRKEPTVISANDETDEVAWSELERELFGDGITKQDVERYKEDIKEYLKKLVLENLMGIGFESTDSLTGDLDDLEVRDGPSRRSSVDSDNSADHYGFVLSANNQSTLQHPGHPDFANDFLVETPQPPKQVAQPAPHQQQAVNSSPLQRAGPTSPPPLPEGWIAYLDQNSGQYYYIRLPTQATQWEFPKGPTTLNHEMAPLSPMPPPPHRQPSPNRQQEGGRAEAVTVATGFAVEEEAQRYRSRIRDGDQPQAIHSPPISVKVKIHGDKDRNVTLRRLTSQEAAAEIEAERIARGESVVKRRLIEQKEAAEREAQLKTQRDSTIMKHVVEQELGADKEAQRNRPRESVVLRRLTDEVLAEREARQKAHRESDATEQEEAAAMEAVQRYRREKPARVGGINKTMAPPPPPREKREHGAAPQRRQRKLNMRGSSDIKPASLKNLFRVSTTSALPAPAIKAEIRRALDKLDSLAVSDVPGGFSCRLFEGPGQFSRQILKFEVAIVKIPLVSLYGIQFNKVSGNKSDLKVIANFILEDLQL